jgi:hypothetical protein
MCQRADRAQELGVTLLSRFVQVAAPAAAAEEEEDEMGALQTRLDAVRS